MIERIIHFSIHNKLIVGVFTLALIIWGVFSLVHLPIDAVPDITNNQVQVISLAPTLAAQEVEQFITQPIELSMKLIPDVEEIRSISRFGLSVVTIVFKDQVNVYLARQMVAEKLKEAEEKIPEGLTAPELGPVTTGLGEIYQYVVKTKPGFESKYSAMDLRTIQDWIVQRQLAGTPGLAEVSAWGGFVKQYEIALNPSKLNNMDVSIAEIMHALEENNENTGGAYIEKGSNAYVIRGIGMVRAPENIEKIVIKTINGVPLLIRDVARVQFGNAIRYGAVTKDGKGEVVGGIAMMLKGENSAEVIKQVKEKVVKIQKTLPDGVVIEPFVDRTKLVNNSIHTVTRNLIEGALIVVFILVLLLGNLRAGLVVASVIPLSMLFAVSMMKTLGISGNLMSLGAIDFGLIVDGAVIIVEATVYHISSRHLKHKLKQHEMDEEVFNSSSKIFKSASFGIIIILIVYIPVLTLSGIEGKMFKPMAETVSLALFGALILSLTYVPMASALFLSRKPSEGANISTRLMDLLHKAYAPVIEYTLNHKKIIIISALVLFGVSLWGFGRLGGEFLPQLEEGDFAIESSLMQGSSLTQSVKAFSEGEKILKERFPEVISAVSRIGSGEVPSDPMPIENGDMMVILKDKKEWTSAKTTEELREKMEEALSEIPDVRWEISQPIQMRFNELMTGIKQDIAVKIYGENIEILEEKANQVAKLISKVEGITPPYIEKVTGLPQIAIEYDHDKLSQYGISVSDVNRVLRTAFAGEKVGTVYEGEKRFDMVVRLDKPYRQDIDDVEALFVPLPSGKQVPISQLAEIKYVEGPAQISRDNAERRIYIGFNVHDRDVESVIEEIQKILDSKLKLPSGYYITYGGQFQNLKEAKARLSVAVPIALLLIFIMLYFTFRSVKLALLIYSAVPLSAIGGIWALYLRDMNFSISAGVGFIALFGVAVLNGIVLISYFNQLKKDGVTDVYQRVREGTKVRLRPVVMTAAVAALGFLPMALTTSAGAEVQKPLATVVIGGLITATLLTLVVLPALYVVFSTKKISWHKLRSRKSASFTVFISFLLFFFQSVSGQSDTVKISSLDDALKIGIQNNLLLKSANYEIEKQQYARKSAVDFEKTSVEFEYGQLNSVVKNDNSVAIKQGFEFPTVYVQQSKLAAANIQSSSLNLEIVKNDLARDIKSIWNQYQYSIAIYKLLNYQDSLYRNFAESVELRYKTGEGSLLEKNAALTLRFEVMNKYKNSQREVQVNIEKLKILLGAESIIVNTQNSFVYYPFFLPKDSINYANNPALQYLKQQIEIENRQIKLQQAKAMPGLSVGITNQTFNGTSENADGNPVTYGSSDRFTSIQAGISIPLWHRPWRGKIQEAKIDARIAENSYQYQVSTLTKNIAITWREYLQYKEIADYYTSQGIPQSEMLIQSADKSFTAGEIGYMEYLQHINNAMSIKIGYLENISNYNQTVTQLEYLTGGY
jgi:heavy metal efflux system protein